MKNFVRVIFALVFIIFSLSKSGIHSDVDLGIGLILLFMPYEK